MLLFRKQILQEVINKYLLAAGTCPDQHLLFPNCPEAKNIWIRRYDLIHREISGNKIFKLSGWMKEYKPGQSVLSFGGAYSNHLLALAAITYEIGIQSFGIIRGEAPSRWNNYLSKMKDWGMELTFISRESYKLRHQEAFLSNLREKNPESLIIPEGGAGLPGIIGVASMIRQSDAFDWMVVPAGTGTTAAGLIRALDSDRNTKVLCIQVLKGPGIIRNELLRNDAAMINNFSQLHIDEHYHFGGYAKSNEELIDFKNKFEALNNFKIDLVYGAKALFGLQEYLKTGKIKLNEHVLYLHTGGLI